MNLLIIGNCSENFSKKLKNSTLLSKLYVSKNSLSVDIPNFDFDTFEDLANKSKKLQIDVIIVTDKSLIEDGIVEFLKSKYFNVISVNNKWLNLEKSRLVAKQLLNYYKINLPKIIRAPKTFPLIFRTNSQKSTQIVESIEDLIQLTKKFSEESTFLEEYLDGESFSMLSLWDGNTLLHFNPVDNLSEVQIDRLKVLRDKLNILFSYEKPDFLGFCEIKLLWANNDWYFLDFIMTFNEKLVLSCIKKDFLYLLEQTIYQKLNEINL